MKRILLFSLLLGTVSFAQVDSLKQMLDYYPLQTGDYWEYVFSSYDGMAPWESYYSAYSVEVIGDTTLTNGLQYKILRRIDFYPGYDSSFAFERIDSSTSCIYKWTYKSYPGTYQDTKVDSLFAQPGDTIVASWEGDPTNSYERTICQSIVNDTVFGMPAQTRQMRSWRSADYVTNYSLAKGIGFLNEEDSYDFGDSWISLVYAKVNGIEYKEKNMAATLKNRLSYYPLQNGDFWEYRVDSYDCDTTGPCKEDTSAYSVEVIGDTLLGRDYYKTIRSAHLYPSRSTLTFFQRIEPATGSVFSFNPEFSNGVQQADSLFAEPGDTFLTITKAPDESSFPFRACCVYDTSDTILETPTQIKYFQEFPMVIDAKGEYSYTLAKGLGLYSFEDSWYQGNSNTTLVYAKINGKEYGTKILVSVKNPPVVPIVFALFQNYPNPFNPTTTIRYQLPGVSHVDLKVYDVLGREIATLVNERQTVGSHSVNFSANTLPSGVYFCRLVTGIFTATRKMILLK
jgi:hypothetical protein